MRLATLTPHRDELMQRRLSESFWSKKKSFFPRNKLWKQTPWPLKRCSNIHQNIQQSNTQHNDTHQRHRYAVSVYAESWIWHWYAECRYAECCRQILVVQNKRSLLLKILWLQINNNNFLQTHFQTYKHFLLKIVYQVYLT